MALKPRLRWGLPLTLASLAMIGWFTLRPAPEDAEAAARLPWTCLFPCGDYGLRDALLNTVLFLPLGVGLGRLLPARRALLLAALTTVTVEFIQYCWLVGRDPSLRDILTNTLGGGLGLVAGREWRRLLLPSPRGAVVLAALAALGWTGTIAATALLVRPALPATTYWGQWAPDLGQFAPWQGALLSATVRGWPLPSGRLADSDRLRTLLRADSMLVEARVLAAPPTPGLASIVSVFDSDQREILLLGQSGRGYVFRMRTGLNALELGEITPYLADPPPTHPGDTLTLRGGVINGAWFLSATTATGHAERRVPFGAGLLWSALLPYHPLLGPLGMYWSGLWLGLLLLPAAFWAGQVRVPGVAVAVLGVAGLWVVSRLAGLATPPAAEWIGCAVGGLTGAAMGRWSAARNRPGAPATLH